MPPSLTFESLSAPDFLLRTGGSLGIVLMLVLAYAWLGRVRKNTAKQTKDSPAPPPDRKKGRAVRLIFLLCLLALAGWALLEIWNYDLRTQLSQRGVPVDSILKAVVIVAVAVGAIELTSLLAQRFIARISKAHGDRHSRAKLRTVAPLISGLLNATIMLTAAAMLLSEAGVEIAPLIAGAGVAGIAIGFGAQSLVKDLFTGAFLIIEDIVNHGDAVEISGVVGTVEAMTLRTIRIRDFDGTLHIFPYGEAQVIHNKASSFSCFVFELQISYLSDIDVAIDVVRQVGAEICSDEKLAKVIVGKLDFGGVDRLSDNGVILKGRIRTSPGDSGAVGQAFMRLVKLKLDAAGVLIAHRHQPVPTFDTIKDEVAVPTLRAPDTPPRRN
jgi:small-conductance mechanosensitive channel